MAAEDTSTIQQQLTSLQRDVSELLTLLRNMQPASAAVDSAAEERFFDPQRRE